MKIAVSSPKVDFQLKGRTDVTIDGVHSCGAGNPQCHYMYGFRICMKKVDPFQNEGSRDLVFDSLYWTGYAAAKEAASQEYWSDKETSFAEV